MSTTPSERTLHATNSLGIEPGAYVQEIGYDDDVDFALRDAIAESTGEEMADEDEDDVFDVVVMWWRSDDPDLTDALVDAQTTLKQGGEVWLLTPKAGRDGHISPADISQSAPTAGMHVTRTVPAAEDWAGFRLVGKKNFS
ncbi:DUF3052 domain-containing protein [Brevibacterium litoralis]|uniref:DUF3052 domain-containing protein n=1 Tax=Brevibacterium litoralis TaxID=3138935 RepID=UPI0032EF71C1